MNVVKGCTLMLTNCHEMLFPLQRARLMLYFQNFLCYLFMLVVLQFSVPLSCDFHYGIWTGECLCIWFDK